MDNWENIVVSPDTSLKNAMSKINSSGIQFGLVLDSEGKLAGTLSDGDIRRAILREESLESQVSKVMKKNPTTVSVSVSNQERMELMRQKTISHLPILNEDGLVIGLVRLEELIGEKSRLNWVVLMAGGLGKRLRPLTDDSPKPLLPVGGKPILETLVERLSEQGFSRIFLSINYKADMIREYFQEGKRWGVQIEYLQENEQLGTVGSLSLLPEIPTKPLIVINGDVLTLSNFDALLQYHSEHKAIATMGVQEYNYKIPYGVVQMDEYLIKKIIEKPVKRYLINAGIYALSPEVLQHIPKNRYFDMTSLFDQLLYQGEKVAAFPVHEYWLDIGKMDDFQKANGDYLEHFQTNDKFRQ